MSRTIKNKITFENTFPQEWKRKTLCEIGKFSKGSGISGSQLRDAGVPCVGYGDLYMKYDTKFCEPKSFIDESAAKDSKEISKGALLFTATGETAEEIGKCVCYYGDEKIYAGGDIFILQVNDLNPLFVAYQQNIFPFIKQKARLGQGHSVVHLRLEDVKKLSVIYPSDIKEQEKIAEILMKWDEAIELQESLIEKLESQKKGLLRKLLKPQDDWKPNRLQDMVKKLKAKAVKIHDNGKFPIIDMEYVANRKFVNFTNDKGVFICENDVLLLWDGAGAGTPVLGAEGMLCSTFVNLILSPAINAGFLYYFLCNIQERNNKIREGSGVPHMPKDFLKIQKIFLPNIDMQIHIYNSLSCLDSSIILHFQKLTLLKNQRKALMQKLLTGIVRVKV